MCWSYWAERAEIVPLSKFLRTALYVQMDMCRSVFVQVKVCVTANVVISPSLLVLMVLNLGLFFKLWAMEDVAHQMYLSTKQQMREKVESRWDPLTSTDTLMSSYCGCSHFLELVHQWLIVLHAYSLKPELGSKSRDETQLLKTVLQDSIHLLEQVSL